MARRPADSSGLREGSTLPSRAKIAQTHSTSLEKCFFHAAWMLRARGLLIKLSLIFLSSLVSARVGICQRRTTSSSVGRKMNYIHLSCTSLYITRALRTKISADLVKHGANSVCLRAHIAVDVSWCLRCGVTSTPPGVDISSRLF